MPEKRQAGQLFSFKPLTNKEKVKREKELRDIDATTKLARQSLGACLSSDSFSKYRVEYAQAKEDLINMGIRLLEDDFALFGFAAYKIFTNLKFLKMLEDEIQMDMARARK